MTRYTVPFAVCGATEKLACIFSLFLIASRMEDSFLLYNLAISAYDFFFPYFHHIQNFHFLTNGKDITASLRLRSTTNITTLTLWGHYYVIWGLSEHEHCDKAATNSNSENARSKVFGKFAGKRGNGDVGRWVKYWARLSCWISQCYGLLSRGARFETYELFISLIFGFFGGGGAVNCGYWISRYEGPPVLTVFLLQQWLQERASVLPYTFTACS